MAALLPPLWITQIPGYSAVTLKARKRDVQRGRKARKRPERLTECVAFLRAGDVLLVNKPDRLARSIADLLTIVADLTKSRIRLMILSMGGRTAGHP